MATITVDQQKLVMNAFAAQFQNSLVSADIFTWKKFDGEMDDRNGLNVSEQVGPRYDVTETSNGVVDLTSGVQDSVFGSEQFAVNKTFGTSMGWADFVKIRDIGAARESEALKSAATRLAEYIDAYVMNVGGLASCEWTGDAANADYVETYLDVIDGYTRLKEAGVEDGDLTAVLSYFDKAKLGDNVVELPGIDGMSSSTYRTQFSGAIGGIRTLFTQQLPLLTAGTRTNGLVNGAAQNVDYKNVAISAAPGQYMSQTIAIDGLGANGTIKKGEVFTIAGVQAYDNRKGGLVHPARLQQFTVLEDVTADGTGAAAAVRISPALIVPGSGSGGDIAVNTAHATVDAAPADNAAVTFIGAASAELAPRLITQKSAIIINTADLIMPATGMSRRQSLTRVPLSVRMWQDSDFNTGDHRVRFDVALTANVRDRRRMVRINGNQA